MRRLYSGFCLAMFASCADAAQAPVPPLAHASPEAAEAAVEGRKYIAALVAEVRNADRIVVTEHSSELDLLVQRGAAANSVMEVCFHCGQVRWKGSAASPPGSLYAGLAQYIGGIGMYPERDWAAAAEEGLKKRQAQQGPVGRRAHLVSP